MTALLRTTFSAATFFGLVSFLLSSAVFSGLVATPTVVGFSLLTVYGVFAIAALSYATPHTVSNRRQRMTTASAANGELIAFPTSPRGEYRAAA